MQTRMNKNHQIFCPGIYASENHQVPANLRIIAYIIAYYIAIVRKCTHYYYCMVGT